MKICAALVAALALVSTPALALDQLSPRDAVQVGDLSLKLEWLFNMGLVSGVNERGEPRHFALIFNTLIAPRVRKFGPVPTLDFSGGPAIQVSLHDLDRKRILETEFAADSLDRGPFAARTRDGYFAASRFDSALGGVATHLDFESAAVTLSLQVVSTKPQALFGEQGWVDNGAALGRALYLSRTGRVMDPSVSSWIQLDGERIRLDQAQFWEDHQLVSPLHLDILGMKWNWFALHFADHSEAMIYRIESKTTGKLFKLFAQRVRPDGSIESLDGVQVSEAEHEVSQGHSVPTSWDILIPGRASLHLEHMIHAPWFTVTLGAASDRALEGACYTQGLTTAWGDVTLAWAEHTSVDFFEYK